MTNGWTLERKQRQSELIHRWKPWKRSTGPRSEDGRQISKMNAVRHGYFLAQARVDIAQIKRFLNSDS